MIYLYGLFIGLGIILLLMALVGGFYWTCQTFKGFILVGLILALMFLSHIVFSTGLGLLQILYNTPDFFWSVVKSDL